MVKFDQEPVEQDPRPPLGGEIPRPPRSAHIGHESEHSDVSGFRGVPRFIAFVSEPQQRIEGVPGRVQKLAQPLNPASGNEQFGHLAQREAARDGALADPESDAQSSERAGRVSGGLEVVADIGPLVQSDRDRGQGDVQELGQPGRASSLW